LSIEPDNEALKKRQKDIRVLDQQKKPTVPATLRIEKDTNVFLRAKTLEQFTEYREKRNVF
ncbi:MAG: hydroxyacylglutathione hydrolase, partial [Alphaproteobacteria bacterium]|nr:hydroxyacylglutathione hydrolase [Alphaproteobacteria bacterium]